MNLSPAKIRRRLKKVTLQYGIFGAAWRCLIWPLMYVGWRVVDNTPFERRRVKEGLDFDAQYGVDTSRTRSSEWGADINSDSWSEGTGYYPTPPGAVRRSVGALPVALEDYVFIDLGSGKGRVPLVASEFPFKQCIGIEYDPSLHEIAKRNFDRFRSEQQRCHDVQSVCHDATTFPFPQSPMVLFFADPFGGSVLDQFLQHLNKSLEEKPRDAFLIEYDPVNRERFTAAGFTEFGGQDIDAQGLLPEIFYKIKLLEEHTFRNRRGKEYLIFRSRNGIEKADKQA